MADDEANPLSGDTGGAEKASESDGGGGWGGWGITAFSVISDLQKAAQDFSRNAVAIAKNAANEIGSVPEVEAESPEEAEADADNEDDKLRKSTLGKLEYASDDTLLSQGLKALDSSVESFTSGAWSALGNAWKEGSSLVQKLEHSAANLADSINQGTMPVKTTSLAPSIIETGKTFTAKGMDLIERVSKEAIELFSETDKLAGTNSKVGTQNDDEQLEEITFDRCFYIYGGPDQLEELEALSNHHALLFNRKKAKLLYEQKSLYDGKLRQIQQIFSLNISPEEEGIDSDKGKNIETSVDSFDLETRNLCDSNVRKAADMAAGFTNALRGFSLNEISQRTSKRLEDVHSEGVHRLSELCCFCISKFLILGKSIISNANKSQTDDNPKIEWPGDSVSKAKLIRLKARSMSEDVESVSNSFSTGISDILEAYLSRLHNVASGAHDFLIEVKAVEEKANVLVSHLQASRTSALEKIQDAVQYLAYVVISTSICSA